MSATSLADIVQRGNRSLTMFGSNKITCKDGFTLSVVAGGGTYCTPRPSPVRDVGVGGMFEVGSGYAGPYTAVEVGFPSECPEPWSTWQAYVEDADAPTQTVYGYVPVEIVQALIDRHGGEA